LKKYQEIILSFYTCKYDTFPLIEDARCYPGQAMYIDSHAHFDLIMEEAGVTEDLLMDGLRDNDITQAVQVAIDPGSSRWSLDFAKRHAGCGILCTAGIHPSSPAGEPELKELASIVEKAMGGDRLLFGIGECGLDYYRMRQPRETQERSFRFQVELANTYRLPLIVHSRDAAGDTLAVLRETCGTVGIMHCFPGDQEMAKDFLDLGFYISFAGNVTYRSATGMHAAAAYVPLDRLLVETDAPFLTPVPLRGKKKQALVCGPYLPVHSRPAERNT
jgi:TatD DNase family protein